MKNFLISKKFQIKEKKQIVKHKRKLKRMLCLKIQNIKKEKDNSLAKTKVF